MAPITHQPFAGRYLLLEKIATGGMAEVFKAKSRGVEGFEKLVVIKRILPHLSRNPRFVSMFINEAKIAVSLNHGNIVQVFHLGRSGDDYYIAMEYVQGRDLAQLLRVCRQKGLALPISLAVYITAEVARGLDYAHRKLDSSGNPLQIIHRDISPHNVVVSFEGEVKIVDFGIARIASQLMEQEPQSRHGGKFAYMAPEQVAGQPMDARSDLFSLGLLFYELLTGQRAYPAQDLNEKLRQVRAAEVIPARALRHEIGEELDHILRRLLALRPDARYSSAGELYEDLTEHLVSTNGLVTAQDLTHFLKEVFEDPFSPRTPLSSVPVLAFDAGELELLSVDPTLRNDSEVSQAAHNPIPDDHNTLSSPDNIIDQFDSPMYRKLIVFLCQVPRIEEHVTHSDVSSVLQLLSEVHQRFSHAVQSFGGRPASFRGDEFLATWVLLENPEQDALMALRTSLMIVQSFQSLLGRHPSAHPWTMALHSGTGITGRSEASARVLILGDSVRQAETLLRLETVGEPTSGVVVSPEFDALLPTWARASDFIEVPNFAGQSLRFRRISIEEMNRLMGGTRGRSAENPHQPEGQWCVRGDELLRFDQAFLQLDQRCGGVLAVVGEAGIGKSRLMKEWRFLARTRNVGFQIGRCRYSERDIPLAVFRDMVASGCRIRSDDSEEELWVKLHGLLELGLHDVDLRNIGTLFTTQNRSESSQAELHHEVQDGIFRAFRRLIQGMTTDRPMVFVVENLHWADSMSLALLADLVETSMRLPMLVVLTWRPGGRVPGFLPEDSHPIELGRLTSEQVEEFVGAVLQVRSLPPVLVRELYAQTGGNPLHLEQLLNHLQEEGRLVVRDGEALTVTVSDEADVPTTVHGLVETRMQRLSDVSREVLSMLAVIGRQSPREVAERVIQVPSGLDPILHELRLRDLITIEADRISFRNHLTWEVAYAGIPVKMRNSYHLRIGEAMEALYHSDLARHAEEIFYHFETGGNRRRAAKYAELAGDRYYREDFTARAADFYGKALELLRYHYDDDSDEADIVLQMALICLKSGRLQWVIGDRANAEMVLERGLDLAGEMDHVELEAQLLLQLGQLNVDKGDRLLAKSYLEHALELCEAVSATELCCEVLDILGLFYLDCGSPEAANQVFDKGVRLARGVKKPIPMARLLHGKGTYLCHVGSYEEALERFSRALSMVEKAQDRILSGRILNNIGNTYACIGRFEDAMESYRQSGDYYRAVGFMRGVVINHHNIGDLHFRQKRLARAYAYFRESRMMAQDYRFTRLEASNLVYMGYIEAVMGDAARGLKTLQVGISMAQKGGHSDFVATGHLLEGLYYSVSQPDLARQALQKALESARSLGQRRLEDEILSALDQLSVGPG